jgi:hypothetical protein
MYICAMRASQRTSDRHEAVYVPPASGAVPWLVVTVHDDPFVATNLYCAAAAGDASANTPVIMTAAGTRNILIARPPVVTR